MKLRWGKFMRGGMKLMKCKWIDNECYSALKGKKILVAGGTGFIGKRAVELFTQLGLKVYVLSRNKHENTDSITYAKADLNDYHSLKNKFEDTCFDFAVYMAANIPLRGSKKENYCDAKTSTFDPFINFCQAYLCNCKKFIYISSIDVLGGCSEIEYDETAPIRTATPYGLAKYIGELYTKNICQSLGISYGILRFSQVYGPHEPLVRIIPIVKNAMNDGTRFTLVTDGEEKRRFLFVDDAVKAIVNACLYSENDIYNIAGPDSITMKSLVLLIEKTWEKKIDFVITNEYKGEDNVPSINKAKELINYMPDIDMKTGMKIIMEAEK